MLVNRDKIKALHGSFGSGLASLSFESGRSVCCDNGPTVRALQAATDEGDGGRAIGPGHTINNEGIKGLDIIWFEDDLGLILGGFALVSDHPELEVIPLGGSAEIAEDGTIEVQ